MAIGLLITFRLFGTLPLSAWLGNYCSSVPHLSSVVLTSPSAHLFKQERTVVSSVFVLEWRSVDEPYPVHRGISSHILSLPSPFKQKVTSMQNRLQFRADTTDPSCIHSECFLICEDFRRLGYPKVLLNPNVKV